jgi:drug/metabolite transporter (DMT)-like permease
MDIMLPLTFAIIWASASVATKWGLTAAAPLTLAWTRFAVAGILLAVGWRLSGRSVRPPTNCWGPLMLLGFLNTTLYLGTSYVALKVVPAGLFNLFVAANPFLVLLLSRLWLKSPLLWQQWSGLGIAVVGLGIGSWQSMTGQHAPLWGIGLILTAMSSMAIGSVYFQRIRLPLPGTLINIWQLVFGATFLLPAALLANGSQPIRWTIAWWGSLTWLIGAVSIGAMLLWFRLLRSGADRASLWLLLTPPIGYILARIFLKERLTALDGIASLLVIAGLILAQRSIKLPVKAVEANKSSP